MIPSSMKVPVPFDYAFAHGALALGVSPVTDFEKRGQADDQARDKDTGQRVWQVVLMDLDPLAQKFGRDRVKVKIMADVMPVLPPSLLPNYPVAVELENLVLVPWVDSGKCKGAVDCKARLAYSMRCTGVIPARVPASAAA